MATPAPQKAPASGAPDTRTSILWRIYVIMLLMIIGSLVVVLRIGTIQYFQGEALRTKADSMQIMMRPIEAPRGNILAADGSLLATSLPYFNVYMDMTIVPEDTFYKYIDTLSICLATYMDNESTIGSYRERLIRAREEKSRYYPIRRNVSYLELQHMLTFPIFNMGGLNKNSSTIERSNKSGVIVEKISKRQYPFRMLARRTVGYVRQIERESETIRTDGSAMSRDTVMVGLENSFNHILAGEEGMRPMQRMGGIWIPIDDISQIEPRAGMDIVTTIDVNIQDAVHEALLRSVSTYQADHGCAIVMEVATGEVKAIANLGLRNGEYVEDYNYAVGEKAEPGSTFKLATMLSLFEDGILNLKDSVDLQYGKAKFSDEWMEDSAPHGLGVTTVDKAFEVSSNVGIAKLANRYYNTDLEARKRYIQHLKDMNLDKPTKIELAGEADPFIKTPDRPDWSPITVPWMSIGYELELTPIQVASFYAAIANGGKMMRPRLVKEVRSYGNLEKKFEPEVIKRNIVSKEAADFARDLLTRPIEGSMGTARAIRSEQYRFCGKTGTAIMNYKAHVTRGEAKKYRASFAGFFPYDRPVYACVVVVTNPRSGFYGGTVAAPVFKEIADKCYSKTLAAHAPINTETVAYKGEKLPDLQVGFKADFRKILDLLSMPYMDEANTAWTVGRVQGDSLFLLMRNMQEETVPNVVGMGLRDALFLLENRKIKVQVVGVGKVKSQSVKPGRSTQGIGLVTLVLG